MSMLPPSPASHPSPVPAALQGHRHGCHPLHSPLVSQACAQPLGLPGTLCPHHSSPPPYDLRGAKKTTPTLWGGPKGREDPYFKPHLGGSSWQEIHPRWTWGCRGQGLLGSKSMHRPPGNAGVRAQQLAWEG